MTTLSAAPHSRLAHFPVVFFATVMGLSGLALVVSRAEHALGRAPVAGPAIAVLATLVFAAIAVTYAMKAATRPDMVAAEWRHPVRMAFFPAASISLILLGTAFQASAPALAYPLWAIGALLQLAGTLSVVSAWIGHRPFEPQQMTPAWFIPAVGNILVPVAGVGFGAVEVSWFFFAVGLTFWVVLLTLVFNRLVFHAPLPERLLPTLMILVAPPAVGFVAWIRLSGDLDPFGRILYYAAVLFALVVLTQSGRLRRVGFAMSWWAYSFPLAALTLATFVYADAAASTLHGTAAFALAVLTTVVIVGLSARTLTGMTRGEICRPE
jgi:tellurite resistance protein